MTPARHSALEYLRRPRDAPWRWSDGGRVLAWSDGTTIAFREELRLVIERLAPSGLPAFAEIVVLLAACRGRLPELPNFPSSGGSPGVEQHRLVNTFDARWRERIKPCVDALRSLASAPPDLAKRTAGKAAFVEAILQGRRQCGTRESELVVAGIAETFAEKELNDPPPDAPALDLIRVIHHVGEALRAHTPESLRRRMRTGLDALPQEAQAVPDLPPDERARRLLGALRTDESFAGLALAARDLMAALHLPQLLAHPDELAIGGSSDVSNRGSLDRLLISELVHDDATLAARVALNEALYLQREPPARRPTRSLVLLLEVGICMWGTPRVLSAAAALALVARHRSQADVTVFRAAGATLEAVDLLTRTGLEAHLAKLRLEVHPGEALPALGRRLGAPATTDVVILTHRDALADGDFQRAARHLPVDRAFALTADRDGTVQLWPLTGVTPRPLCAAIVEIRDLAPTPRQTVPSAALIDTREDPDLPAIFRVRPFPLLLPVNAKMELALSVGQGGVCVTSDHRLLRWENVKRGAQQLATDLPSGRTLWLQPDVQGRVVLVKGRSSAGQMAVVLVPLGGETPLVTRFTGPQQARAVFVDAGALVLVLNTRVVAVAISSGEIVAQNPIDADVEWIFGRYFRIAGRLAFACWDGAKVRWESLAVSRLIAGRDILLAFDRQGIGPWLLLRDGRVLSPTGSEHAKFGFAPVTALLTDDHETLTAVRGEGRQSVAVRMQLTSRAIVTGSSLPTDRRTTIKPPTRSLQKDFATIACAPGQPLRLQRRKGRWIEVFADGPHVRLVASPPLDSVGEWQSFTALKAPPFLGCSLEVARWADGRRAWLDSRGLLHLRSGTPALPEISLVLDSSGPIAAWCSDGLRCGPDFFHPEPVANPESAVRETLSRLLRFGKVSC